MFIQIYNCLVVSGIRLKAGAKGHLVKGSLQQLPKALPAV